MDRQNRGGLIREAAATGRQRTAFAEVGLLAAWLTVSAGTVSSWSCGPWPPQYKFTQLTPDSEFTTTPAISPDGRLVAYASYRAGDDNLDIWVRQIAGGDAIRLTTDEAAEYEPVFSPDNKQIAFRSDRDKGGIYIVPAEGGAMRLLANEGRYPQFSPDGKWIAYAVGSFLGGSKIYIVAARGGISQPLETNIPFATWPIGSPDGENLLFTGNTEPTYRAETTRDWYVVSSRGGTAIKTGAYRVLRSRGLYEWPQAQAWLAQGNQIVFSATLGDRVNLWRVPISTDTWRLGGEPQRLTTGVDQEQASVSSAGLMVYSSRAAIANIWRVPIDANRGKVTGEM